MSNCIFFHPCICPYKTNAVACDMHQDIDTKAGDLPKSKWNHPNSCNLKKSLLDLCANMVGFPWDFHGFPFNQIQNHRGNKAAFRPSFPSPCLGHVVLTTWGIPPASIRARHGGICHMGTWKFKLLGGPRHRTNPWGSPNSNQFLQPVGSRKMISRKIPTTCQIRWDSQILIFQKILVKTESKNERDRQINKQTKTKTKPNGPNRNRLFCFALHPPFKTCNTSGRRRHSLPIGVSAPWEFDPASHHQDYKFHFWVGNP